MEKGDLSHELIWCPVLFLSDKPKKGFEEVAEEEDKVFVDPEKKKQFPGLCLPDDPTRAKQLLSVEEEEEEESEDVKVAKEALSEVGQLCLYNLPPPSLPLLRYVGLKESYYLVSF